MPSVPQVEAACAVHSASGSVLLAMLPHVPLDPLPFFAAVHAWQVPVHVVSQHTPSTQAAVVDPSHSRQLASRQSPPPPAAARLQVPPGPLLGWQTPFLSQNALAMQSLSLAQLVLHAVAP